MNCWKRDVLPPVQCTDIFNYLVLGTSFCSTERFKAFKSMDAYKYFECARGFVLSVAAKKIDKKLYYVHYILHDDYVIIITQHLCKHTCIMFNFLTKFSMKYIIIVNGSIERYNSGTEIVKSIAHSDSFVNCCIFSE